MSVERRHRPGISRRLLAAGCAGLVLALAVFAASPALHAKLHGPNATQPDECAVVLFSAGVSAPPVLVVVLPTAAPLRAVSASVAEALVLSAPRYLRQPERGPPVSV